MKTKQACELVIGDRILYAGTSGLILTAYVTDILTTSGNRRGVKLDTGATVGLNVRSTIVIMED